MLRSPSLRICQFVFLASLLFFSRFSLVAAPAVTDNPAPIVFGIAPFMSPMALIKRMAPLRDYLTDYTHRKVIIETATNAADFSKRTMAGRYDFVLTNPTFSLMAMDRGGFQIIAAQKKKLSGRFIVMQNSPLKTLDDLEGKQVGAPPKVGFMGQLIKPYLSHYFKDRKMPVITHFNSHNAAISGLRLGDTDATLIVSFMEKHLLEKGLKLRSIHNTAEFPGMTIIAKGSMSTALADKLREALLDLDRNEIGKAVLSRINMSGYQTLDVSELQVVRPYLPSRGR
jgi:phosphonate transport system substrate-binding protein